MRELDSILERYTSPDADLLKGAVFIAVDHYGKTLYSRASGSRGLDVSADQPLAIDSVFWIASMTKLSTAVATMVAIEKGLIKLDTNVREIVPELADLDILLGFKDDGSPILKKCTSPITLRQLLSHSSGFTYDMQHEGIKKWSTYVGRTENTFTGSYKGYLHPLIFEPGNGWSYGPGMDWAGRTVEAVSGQSLEEFMKENIWSKLSMDSTTFKPELRPDFPPRQMDLAWRNPAGRLIPGKVPLGNPAEACCGGVGLYSTPADHAKLLTALLTRDNNILKSSSLNEILRPQLEDNKHFVDIVCGSKRTHLGQTWPLGMSGSFGLSSSINADGFPGRRAKNSANWQGMPGIHCWMDRETGVAGCFFTQILPPGDAVVTNCLLELETALYKELRST